MLHALDAARVVGEWFGPFAAIAGHSFGGAVAANAVAGTVNGIPPLAAERLVLIAAPSSMPAIFEDFARLLNVGPRSYRVMAAQVERLTGRPLEDYVASREFGRSQPPTLVIHSPDDREVLPTTRACTRPRAITSACIGRKGLVIAAFFRMLALPGWRCHSWPSRRGRRWSPDLAQFISLWARPAHAAGQPLSRR